MGGKSREDAASGREMAYGCCAQLCTATYVDQSIDIIGELLVYHSTVLRTCARSSLLSQ